MTNNEKKFWDILTNLFVGAEVKGKSGFISLMKAKQSYFKKVNKELLKEIDDICENNQNFKDEMYDKLYSFFHRYFSQSGSIYYNYTPLFYNVYTKAYDDKQDEIKTFSTDYEQIISNKQDTSLFYKTQMLYYVKSDKIFKDLEITLDSQIKYIFDVSSMEGKKANEKKEVIYELKSIENKSLSFYAVYSEKGKTTKISDILKVAKKENINLKEEDLKKAFNVFEKQSNIDYFINKDAKKFLTEQLDMWIYQYMFSQEVNFDIKRFNQIQDFKKIALKLINFISQFENELVKIWNKPRFAINSNIVVTIDKLKSKNFDINKIKNHTNFKEQQKEWEELGINQKDNLIENEFLPIDTKYFKDLKEEIEELFNEDEYDGLLIKSENYQALNTILPRFKGKIDLIYIDPPFNTGSDFAYIDNFQDSTWLSLMENRLELAKDILSNKGSFYLHLDENADYLGRIILKNFNFDEIKKIVLDTNATKDEEADLFGYKSFGNNFSLKSQTIYFCKNKESNFFKLWKPNRNNNTLNIEWLDLIAKPKNNLNTHNKISDYDFFIEKYINNKLELQSINIDNNKIYPLSDIWNDIYSFTQSVMRTGENISFLSSQKPENLIRRIIQSSTSRKNSIVLDFFAGSGTLPSVAHKLNRKYIAIEMGEHFSEFYNINNNNAIEKRLGLLGRMKIVLSGDKDFVAVDKQRKSYLSKHIDYKGGGIFKYYELEQYENILRNIEYKDTPSDYLKSKENYEIKDCFLFDEKLAKAIICKEDSFEVDLSKLYENIDLKETIHNLTGKRPKEITNHKVIFEDKEYELLEILKPLLIW